MKKKLSVAIVTNFPLIDGLITGGVEGASQFLVNGLSESGEVEVHVIAPGKHRTYSSEKRTHCTVHWIPRFRVPGIIRYWTLERWFIQKIVKQINPDIVHFQGALGWSLGCDRKYICTIHGIAEKNAQHTSRLLPALQSSVIALVERIARKAVRDLIIINPYVENELSNQIRGRVWAINNPIDADFFNLERKLGSKDVLYIGRISGQKNTKGLIQAFKIICNTHPTSKLRIAGCSDPNQLEYAQECQQLAHSLGISDRVEFLGALNRPQLAHEFERAGVLALVSLQETAPMVIAEAMSAALPVVASNICGIPYMVKEEVTGLLVDPNDTNDIANKLLKLIDQPELALEFGLMARKEAEEKYHYKAISQRTLDVYKQILNEPKS